MQQAERNLDRIYLDYNATTPVDPNVVEAMLPYLREHFGNPASGQHAWGWTAEAATQKARKHVADLIGAEAGEITFTSGATEANNWALIGLYFAQRDENPNEPFHLITTPLEHNSILNSAKALEKLGAEVSYAPVDSYGRVKVDEIKALIRPSTKLISVIAVNNEIGTINPIRELGALARESRIYLHTDATQAAGKILVDVNDWHVDLLSYSAHKMYGPKGVGALYIRSRNPAVRLNPLIHGGGHEKGLRSGTLNVPGIVGFGAAAEIAKKTLHDELAHTTKLRDLLVRRLLAEVPRCRLNGHPTERSPINASLTFTGRPIDQRLGSLQRLGCSTGSACSAGRVSVSHVLAGIGLSEDDASCTLRLSVGRGTTEEQINAAVEVLKTAFAGA